MYSIAKGVNPQYVALMVRPFIFYAGYFLFFKSIQNHKKLQCFLIYSLIVVVVNCCVYIFQAFTGRLIPVPLMFINSYNGIYEALNSGMDFIDSALFIIVAIMLGSRLEKKQMFFLTAVLLLVIFTIIISLIRGVWISCSLGMIVVILLNKNVIAKKVLYFVIIALTVITLIEPVLDNVFKIQGFTNVLRVLDLVMLRKVLLKTRDHIMNVK